jgi:ribosomal-protein-alanine N-acetyltransferase
LVLKTERLLLRRMNLNDAPFVFELLNSPLWLKYIGDRGVHSLEDAQKQIEEKYLPSYENGLGNFLVEERISGRSVGSCGLYQRDNLDFPDIGFAFLPEYIGRGYGWEAASAIKSYAFNQLKLSRLLGFTLPENTVSRHLLEKLGLSLTGSYQLDNDAEELLLYST